MKNEQIELSEMELDMAAGGMSPLKRPEPEKQEAKGCTLRR